jgi:aryl-alcohol dehydrogenase-like predicted oxidoreductase
MEYTTLGRIGLQVSRLCLGTMTFGRETDESTSHTMLNHFVETADAYSSGASEAIIGNWLVNQNRHDFVIATKVRFGSGLNRRGLGRKHILDAVEGSLRRLKTDYIDL